MNTRKSKHVAGISILALILSSSVLAQERDPDCPPPTGPGPIDLCPIDPELPPVLPPDTPRRFNYPAYSKVDNFTVAWTPSPIVEGRPIYRLEESVNSGGWTVIYQGGQFSVPATNRPRATYAYRVRACSSVIQSICSDYLTGPTMLVNPEPVTNLYTKYPFLHTLDQIVANYRATAPSVRSDLPRAPVAGQTITRDNARIEGNRFILGDGYDVIRSGLKEICFDTEHPDIRIDKTRPNAASTFDVFRISDNRHLAEVLDISEGAKVGFTHEDVTLGLSLEAQRYRNAVRDDTYERVVVKWVFRGELWRLQTPADPLQPNIISMLVPDNADAKIDFRERCGDQYISQANLGAALYIVFTYDLKTYSVEERASHKGTLGLKIAEIFNGSVNNSVSDETKQFLQTENIQVHADQVGGPDGLAASITRANFAEKLTEFVQGTNSSNWAAVDIATSDYLRPAIFSAYNRSQIFADYLVPLIQARRWFDISVQHRNRCAPYVDHDRTVPPECTTSEAEIGTATDFCRRTADWTKCVHPGAYVVPFGVNPVATPLLAWINNNVPKLEDTENKESFAHHVHRGDMQVNDTTCLPAAPPKCFLSRFRGRDDGIGKGFEPLVFLRDNPKHQSTQPTYTVTQNNRCVNTRLYLETFIPIIIGGDSTADFNYDMTVIGFCPLVTPFVIIP